jgi:hypothetical protein
MLLLLLLLGLSSLPGCTNHFPQLTTTYFNNRLNPA